MQSSLNYWSRLTLVAAILLVTTAKCVGAPEADSVFTRARQKMVKQQVEARGVTDTLVLAAMLKVKRHLFVGAAYRSQAYEDYPLPIESGQTISQPYIVALMTELLHLDGSERVLEIGTGSGYQAAILGEISKSVFSIEIIDPLARSASTLLEELGYENITVRAGDGYAGWIERAPFDAIIVTAAPPEIPAPLLDQLAEGGRLVVPVGEKNQTLQLVTKKNGKLTYADLIRVRFVPMTGRAQEER